MKKKGPHEPSRVFNLIKQCTKGFNTNNKKIMGEGVSLPNATRRLDAFRFFPLGQVASNFYHTFVCKVYQLNEGYNRSRDLCYSRKK
jgi:hypothetical protein